MPCPMCGNSYACAMTVGEARLQGQEHFQLGSQKWSLNLPWPKQEQAALASPLFAALPSLVLQKAD